MLWKQMRPNGDFQHLPSWRELVVATALSLRRHHADTLIVPMLRSDKLSPAELADEVLARSRPGKGTGTGTGTDGS
jgi:hypothetical protein